MKAQRLTLYQLKSRTLCEQNNIAAIINTRADI